MLLLLDPLFDEIHLGLCKFQCNDEKKSLSEVDTNMVSVKFFSLLNVKAHINFVAGGGAWLKNCH